MDIRVCLNPKCRKPLYGKDSQKCCDRRCARKYRESKKITFKDLARPIRCQGIHCCNFILPFKGNHKYCSPYCLNTSKLEYQRQYHINNREYILARGKAIHKNRVYRERALRLIWKRSNPAKVSEYDARRRSLKLGVSPSIYLTNAEWWAIQKRFDYRCAYCGKLGSKLTRDHVVPLSKGGDHTALNIVPACISCNCKKHDRPLLVFLRELAVDLNTHPLRGMIL